MQKESPGPKLDNSEKIAPEKYERRQQSRQYDENSEKEAEGDGMFLRLGDVEQKRDFYYKDKYVENKNCHSKSIIKVKNLADNIISPLFFNKLFFYPPCCCIFLFIK